MKIVDKRTRFINYGDLSTGSCFELNGNFYIKTDVIEDFIYLSINLATGERYKIVSKTKVTLIHPELWLIEV